MTRVATARSLSELRQQFEHIIAAATAFRTRTADGSFRQRPDPQSWSATECLAHLNLSVDPYFSMWRDALEQSVAAADGGSRGYILDFWGRVLVWTLEPPPRFRFRTTQRFQPVINEPAADVLDGFVERQHAILQVLDTAAGKRLDIVKIVSPFARQVRYTIWSSFCVTAAHQRRHLWQADLALRRVEQRS